MQQFRYCRVYHCIGMELHATIGINIVSEFWKQIGGMEGMGEEKNGNPDLCYIGCSFISFIALL